MSVDDVDTEDDVGDVPMPVSNRKEQEAEEQSIEVDDIGDAQDVGIAEQPQEMHQERQIEHEAEKTQEIPDTLEADCSTLSGDSGQSENPVEQRRYSSRDRKEPDWYGRFITHLADTRTYPIEGRAV